VVEATVPSALSDHLPLTPVLELESLHVLVGGADGDATPPPHLLMLQINRFACGGLVITSSAHYQAANGYSMSTFFHALADAARANNNDAPLPSTTTAVYYHWRRTGRPPSCRVARRGASSSTVATSSCAAEDAAASRPALHRVDPSEIANVLLHLPSEFVAGLKAATAPQRQYTTFETVSAHLWRKITLARGRADDASRTALYASVNVVLKASAATGARDLARGTLADAAALVRAGVRARDRQYFQSFIDFGELHGGEELEPTRSGTTTTSCCRTWIPTAGCTWTCTAWTLGAADGSPESCRRRSRWTGWWC
jgi:hypothetical protein